MSERYENKFVQFWFEDDILHGFYKKDCIITLEAAKEVVKLRLQIQQGKVYKCAAYIGQVGVVTTEARKFFAQDGYEGIDRLAIICNSPIKAVLGNIYMMIEKPVKPTRMFKTREEAIKWLRE